jgi:hypothetical protein
VSNRIVRINELVQREISDILRRATRRGGRDHDHRGEGGSRTCATAACSSRSWATPGDGRRALPLAPRQAPEIRGSWAGASCSSSCRTSSTCSTSRATAPARVLQGLDEIEPWEANPQADRFEPWGSSILSFPRPSAGCWPRRRPAVAVVGHARPDGDCIGSQVALARVLGRGGRGVLRQPDPVPRRLAYSPGPWSSSAPTRPSSCPRTSSRLRRLRRPRAGGGAPEGAFPAPAGNIDHHLSNEGSRRSTSWTAPRRRHLRDPGGPLHRRGLPSTPPPRRRSSRGS